MRVGARTPEELETLFEDEDAFMIRDRAALVGLFEEGAVVAPDDRRKEARGEEAIAQLATAIWTRNRVYLAEPRRVLQARDVALVVADGGIHVVRRGSAGAWRYSISLLSVDHTTTWEAR
jgi:hypothetical protein